MGEDTETDPFEGSPPTSRGWGRVVGEVRKEVLGTNP